METGSLFLCNKWSRKKHLKEGVPMNTVEPIRDMDLVLDVADYLARCGFDIRKTIDKNEKALHSSAFNHIGKKVIK